MKKIFIILMLVAFAAGNATSQDQPHGLGFAPKSYYTFAWNTTFTLGDFTKWVANGSPAGFDFGGRYMVQKGLFAGFNFGWQRVSQSYGYQTYYGDDGGAITATNYRFTWMVPFTACVGYHFMPDKLVSPYFCLGIGGDYMEHHLLVQEYDIYKTRWDFTLVPEVGALVKFGEFSSWGGLIAFNYKWTTNQIELTNNLKTGDLSMLNLKVGVVLLIR
jgi:hypothetical protein